MPIRLLTLHGSPEGRARRNEPGPARILEAFKILESEGQLHYEPHRGHKVASLSLTDLLEVCRIRQLLEAEAARAAFARKSDSSVLADLQSAAGDIETASASGAACYCGGTALPVE